MTQHPPKSDFPVGQVRRYLEPGPIVLVTSRWQGETNIMTLGWHTVMEFTPSLVEVESWAALRWSRSRAVRSPTSLS